MFPGSLYAAANVNHTLPPTPGLLIHAPHIPLYPAHANETARVPERAPSSANHENAALSVRAGQSFYKSDFHAKIVEVGKYVLRVHLPNELFITLWLLWTISMNLVCSVASFFVTR